MTLYNEKKQPRVEYIMKHKLLQETSLTLRELE